MLSCMDSLGLLMRPHTHAAQSSHAQLLSRLHYRPMLPLPPTSHPHLHPQGGLREAQTNAPLASHLQKAGWLWETPPLGRATRRV